MYNIGRNVRSVIFVETAKNLNYIFTQEVLLTAPYHSKEVQNMQNVYKHII